MKNKLSAEQSEELLKVLRIRFENNMNRHEGLDWDDVQKKLEANPGKLWSLDEMERTEGEPDVVGFNPETNEYTFFDCSTESPKGRRSLCFDHEALEKRKEHKPAGSAINMAEEMVIKLLDEVQYKQLQKLGKFDAKTSSWIATPIEIRKLGGALFSDFRYNTVFVYHNGADSYYAARGFRGTLNV
ncbi:hypothetical protein Flavo103_28460 [Flavobacterium collinsii]|uniref:DUF4256 domain-containing protein n=1 Tax=Flavobacterium collinsii TaxID=1114861 RepID=UPI0022C458DD|nr:DUF4256 domain-containing protein [Flavobacterium collinsii]GIQ59710.1 hypothetical protein Flavo103_28460 [Flavobacterium collinsii]